VNGDGVDGIGRIELQGGDGAIHVDGDYVQNGSSALVAEIPASGVGAIQIDGNVAFGDGAVVEVSAEGAEAGEYALLEWSGTATGAPTLAGGVDPREWSLVLTPGELRAAYHPIRVPALDGRGVALLAGLLLATFRLVGARWARAQNAGTGHPKPAAFASRPVPVSAGRCSRRGRARRPA
jgi:hypothetical protein